MELYFVICVVERSKRKAMQALYSKLSLPMILSMPAKGTATAEHLNLYGLEATEKALIVAAADGGKARQLIKDAKRELYIDIPGNGIILTVPIKSVGGERTLAYLTNNIQPESTVPALRFEHELIMAVVNEGHTDSVMDAARSAGAAGGTVLHAKGTGDRRTGRFFGLSLAEEKELILIVSPRAGKAEIMKAIIEQAGPDTPSAAIAFSLPISDIAGLRTLVEE